MRTYIRLLPYKFLLISVVLLFAVQAHALSITPSTTPQWYGNETNPPDINEVIFDEDKMGSDYSELYKSDVSDDYDSGITVGIDSGDYASDYTTVFSGDPNDATITWVGDNYISSTALDPAYMLVKDGDADPAWYLFELSNRLWDGQETLYLTGFWPNQGAISHVSLYGTGTQRVPEPAAMLLMGLGLVGIAGWTRGRLKKKR